MYSAGAVIDGGVFLLGGGGHAKVLADELISQKISIIAIVGPQCDSNSIIFRRIPLISDADFKKSVSADGALLINGVGSLPRTSLRQHLYDEYTSLGFGFVQVISSTALVSTSAFLGSGVQVFAGAIIRCDARVGNNTIINTRAVIEHDCAIGSHCHIAPSATLSGGVHLGDRSHIGTGAVVIQGVSIGSDSIIGAGAVVTKDVPDNAIFFPAVGTLKLRE